MTPGTIRCKYQTFPRRQPTLADILASVVVIAESCLGGSELVPMDNHYHLLLELSEANLSRGVKLRNYGVVATNAKRYERRWERDRTEKARMKQVLAWLNCDR